MKRYIDAEKLIAEIERRLNIVNPHKDTFESAAACRQELIWMKDFITSLQQEQPAESDAIKGGDFISDGKRVFLVLANVKERNLGETFSTFCESSILGVDGVVYCEGHDFKKYKRATSDERAKFIHDLKVGVELKEPPAEWSEEDEAAYGDLIWCIEQAKKSAKDENDMGNIWFAENWVKNRLRTFRPQPHWKPSEEQMKVLKDVINRALLTCRQQVPLESLYNDLQKLL